MPIRIRRNICMTWLDPEGGKRLGRGLQKRLETKLDLDPRKTKRSRFVTLTYDRTPYGDHGQYDLWQQHHRGDGHIKLFIRRLERRHGKKLTGKWIAKKEFQDGGWLHWHLIFYDTGNISIEEITEAWGMGHCHIERINKDASEYIAKYQAKPGVVPGWLYDLPGRSLKLVQCSPGFWAHEKDPDHIPEPRPTYQCREYNKAEPIWQRMEIARQTISIRQDKDIPRKLYGDHNALLIALRAMGHEYLGEVKTEDGRHTGIIEIDATFKDAQYILNVVANKDQFNNSYRKTFTNHSNLSNQSTQAAGSGLSAPACLLDIHNKNKDAQPADYSEHTNDIIMHEQYETQADFYGWATLATVDRDYAFDQSHVAQTINDPDITLDGTHLPF